MPRPIFGQADWWTFEECDNWAQFPKAKDHDYHGFDTDVAGAADHLAREMFGFADAEEEMDADGSRESGYPTWPGLEFCVSRGTMTVLMVRRRE